MLFRSISAVLEVGASHPLDFDRRLRAVSQFRSNPDAASLAAANKRVRNILKKSAGEASHDINPDLLSEAAEIALSTALTESAAAIAPAIAQSDFQSALRTLAGLRAVVDQFFDQVMVMADDTAVRANRLALLNRMSELFLGVADISLLQTPEA